MIRKFQTLAFVIFAVISSYTNLSANTREIAVDEFRKDSNLFESKIYVTPDEILLTKNGIYYLLHGEALPVISLNCDEKGVYIEPVQQDSIRDSCPNGHKIYHTACMGCAFWWCPYRCKCYSPW